MDGSVYLRDTCISLVGELTLSILSMRVGKENTTTLLDDDCCKEKEIATVMIM